MVFVADHTNQQTAPEEKTVLAEVKGETGPRLSERIFEYVVINIANGKLKPTEKISQRKLAQRLGVSPIPVREAMEKLLQCGWIDRFPQRGTYVKSFTNQEILEVYRFVRCTKLRLFGYSPQE